jgi:tripartite-type tricarboxylate transporter receptor subunit TctC
LTRTASDGICEGDIVIGLRSVVVAGLVGVGLLAGNAAIAQPYPSKPVRIIVNQPPGGGSDSTGRVIFLGLQEILGRPVVVENVVGGSGAIGIDVVKRAEPDGHTLLFTASIAVTNQVANPKASYDITTDLTPITLVGETAYIMAVSPRITANNAKELAAFARTKELNWGISQFGSGDHFASAIFINAIGAKALVVPYKGAGPQMIGLLAGEIDAVLAPPTTAIPQVLAGKIKAIGVTGLKRMEQLPNVMTIAEAGYPAFEATSWYGIWGPKSMSPALVATIQQAVAKALKQPKAVDFFQRTALTPVGSTSEDFAALIASTLVTYRAVAASANIKVE